MPAAAAFSHARVSAIFCPGSHDLCTVRDFLITACHLPFDLHFLEAFMHTHDALQACLFTRTTGKLSAILVSCSSMSTAQTPSGPTPPPPGDPKPPVNGCYGSRTLPSALMGCLMWPCLMETPHQAQEYMPMGMSRLRGCLWQVRILPRAFSVFIPGYLLLVCESGVFSPTNLIS